MVLRDKKLSRHLKNNFVITKLNHFQNISSNLKIYSSQTITLILIKSLKKLISIGNYFKLNY